MADGTTDGESFEEVLRKLRLVVERLEGGEMPLDDALRAFEEGVRLTRRGNAVLDAAEKRVEMLVSGRLEPFPDAPPAALERDGGDKAR